MNIKKTKFLILIMIITTLLYGCKRTEKVDAEDPPKPVTIMEATTESYSNDIEISGNVKPAQLIKQGFKVAGVINNVYVKEGDNISEGQTLVSLNPHDYELGVIAAQSQYDSLNLELNSKIQSAVNQAEANVDFIRTQLDRVRRLHEKGAVATKTVEELEVALVVAENKLQEALDAKDTSVSQLRQAEAALELAQSRLNDTTLQSPINGTIVKQIAEIGETMAPGYPVFVLGRLDTLEVEVGIPDRLVEHVKKGEKVKMFIHGVDKEVEGVISNIDTTADVETRTFGVKIDIDNPEGDIKPGMIANVVIGMDNISSIMIPIDAVTDDTEGTYVFVYDEATETVSQRIIEVGEVYTDKIQIISGLEDGELIVFQGQYGLLDGEKVNARRVENND
ncbi:efflux RND transporter periplasmic adaptor subunit [Tissierellaceae bacterium HCP3S3_D8]